jgi:hypothetical protein
MANIDPPALLGISLSHAIDMSGGASAPINGPGGDDTFLTVNLATVAPLCGPGSLTFYNQNFSQIQVISNARVQFGTADTDFSPTVAEALLDSPFVGHWCDLSPNLGGRIQTSYAAPILTVAYQNVPYFGNAGITNNFQIIFDASNGQVQISNIPGMQLFPPTAGTVTDAFLGMSPGTLGATDPGPFPYALGFQFGPGGLNMIYQFGQSGTLAAGINTLLFIPAGSNYDVMGL